MKYTLEICAGSLRSALAAQAGGANRIELCDNLAVGGTTPSYGMIKTCKSLLDIPVFPIIRPRGGNFVYSDEEFEVMKQDVICCAELGCEGVVLGILATDGGIDIERCTELVELAGNMEVTFHRAFDRCNDQEKGLEDIIALGCNRILTSGVAIYAEDAIPELKRLVDQAGNRIIIIPGSGITDQNFLKIATETGAFEFHSTAKNKAVSGFEKNANDDFGNIDMYETNPAKVAKMRKILNSFFVM